MIEICLPHGTIVRLNQGRFTYDDLGDRFYIDAVIRNAWNTGQDPAFDQDAADAIVQHWGGRYRVVADPGPRPTTTAVRRRTTAGR